MAAYSKRSSEEVKKEIEAYNQKVIDIGESFKMDPNQLVEYFSFASRFYNYSVKNQKLIFAQNPTAEFVGSFQHFKEKGYSVERGQKGLKVFVPVESTYFYRDKKTIKLIDATKEERKMIESKEIKTYKQLNFKLGSVFDVSQTNCPVNEYPKIFNFGVPSMEHKKMYETLKDHFIDKGMEINEKEISSISLKGYYVPGEDKIEINPKLQDTERLSTFIHEISHKLLDHQGHGDVHQIEFEADALAVMICSRLGVEVSEGRKKHLSFNYKDFIENQIKINSGKENKDPLDESIKKVNSIFKNEVDEIERVLKSSLEKVVEDKNAEIIEKPSILSEIKNKKQDLLSVTPEVKEFLKEGSLKDYIKKVKQEVKHIEKEDREKEIKGSDIMDMERFSPNTRHMVILDVINENSPVGDHGDRMRIFLDDSSYRKLKDVQEKGSIKIKDHAKVILGNIRFDPKDKVL